MRKRSKKARAEESRTDLVAVIVFIALNAVLALIGLIKG